MKQQIVLSVTLSVQPDRLAEFTAAVASLVATVQESEPGLLFYSFYLDADEAMARAIHVYADSASLERHTAVSAEPISDVLQFATLTSLEILGEPSSASLENVAPHRALGLVAGFARLG